MLVLVLPAFAAPAFPASVSPDTLLSLAREDHPLVCQTDLVRQLRATWDQFDPAEQAELDARFAAKGHTLGPQGVFPNAAPVSTSASCWTPWYDHVLQGEHFEVQWDEGVVDEDTARDFLDSLDYDWSVEVDDLGWNSTNGSKKYLLPVYIDPDYTDGAYTTVDSCSGDYDPYIVIGSNSFYDWTWSRNAGAHEFNHAIQFSTTYAPEAWWWEATATYVEELVYPNDDEWSWYVTGYTNSPELRMDADSYNDYDEFFHMYGMSIWGFYLDNHQGGTDIVRQTWEAAADNGYGYYSYSAEDALTDLGIDFDAAYADFIARNAVMDYTDHRSFPDIDEVDSVDTLPDDGSSRTNSEPEAYGQNYIHIESGLGTGTLHVDFASDDHDEWLIELVEVDKTSVLRMVTFTTTDGTGALDLDDYGAEDVELIVSPLSSSKKSYSYSWTASLVEPVAADTGGSGDTPGDTPKSGDDDGTGTGCGCASTAPTTAWLPGILAGFVLLARRRRSA